MRAFGSDELERMQATQHAAMRDRCVLEIAANAPHAYGYGLAYSAGAALACGLHMSPSREVMESGQVAMPDARLRLPLGTNVTGVDRVRVTHRYGALLSTPLVYDVIGLPERGPSGLQLNLRLSTTGQASVEA